MLDAIADATPAQLLEMAHRPGLAKLPVHDQTVWATIAARPDLNTGLRTRLASVAENGPRAMTFPPDDDYTRRGEQWARTVLGAPWLTPTRVGAIAAAAGHAAVSPEVIVPLLLAHPNGGPAHLLRWLESTPNLTNDDRLTDAFALARADLRADAMLSVVRVLISSGRWNSSAIRSVLGRLRAEGFVHALTVEGWRALTGMIGAGFDASETALIRCARTVADACATPVPTPIPVRYFHGTLNDQDRALAGRYADDPGTTLPQLLALPLQDVGIWAKVAGRDKVPGPVKAKLVSTITQTDLAWLRTGNVRHVDLGALIGAATAFCTPAWYTPARLNTVAGRCLGQLNSHNPTTLRPILDAIAANPAADLNTLTTILTRFDSGHHPAVLDWAETAGVPSWAAAVPVLRLIIGPRDDTGSGGPAGPAWVGSVRSVPMLEYHLRRFDAETQLAILLALPSHTGTLREMFATHTQAA